MVYSNDNTIMNNSICLNTDEGIYLDDSHNNSIYHNVFNNSKNVVIRNYNNDYWNTTNEKGGGNYWFTPNGTGFSETHPDNNGDGFCDDPYPIATDNIDYLPRLIDTTGPIMAVHSPANKSVLNVSRFIVNVTAVDASGVDKIMTELNNWNNTLMEYSNFYYMSYGGISDGNHSLAFYAFDNLGHKSVKKLYFVIDTTAPNVTINSPNGTLKTSKILINVSSSDDTSGIKEVIANINNENIILTKTGDYYVAEKPLNDGTYLLNVKSTDNANNSNSTSVNITIDTYVPSNNNNNNRHGKIDASTNIDSKSLRRTVSDSAIVYGSSFDKQLAENLKENIHSDDYRIDRDTIIIGGPISNRIANQYNDRFSISVTNDNPGENRGIIQVISIPSGSSTVVQNYKLIYIAGSDRLGTEAALKYFETLTELPEEPIVVEWTSSGYKVVN
ncbi:parallel beta-helix repeat protein [Methanococcus voltae]|nr:parallel beta-helix repeat protein [Methanococcus voltae]